MNVIRRMKTTLNPQTTKSKRMLPQEIPLKANLNRFQKKVNKMAKMDMMKETMKTTEIAQEETEKMAKSLKSPPSRGLYAKTTL